MSDAEYKQVILVRMDLKLPKGKLAAQVGHAAVSCSTKSRKMKRIIWTNQGSKKVVLKVLDLEELQAYHRKALDHDLIACMIKDAGKTTVKPGTITCLGIGPDQESKIDAVTGDLQML